MTWLICIIIFGYSLILLLLSKEALTYPKTSDQDATKRLSFSIIVNYHNEEENLPRLLKSISQIDYDFSLLQWIFVNDGSQDQSHQILKNFQISHPQIEFLLVDRFVTSNSAKKDGITQAMAMATSNRIVTTDADCQLPMGWLNSYNAMYQKHEEAHFIAAPVVIKDRNEVVTTLQSQEMMALQMMTIGGFSFRQPFMCNGANMSFTKTAFQSVEGYLGNDHISSGDDIFLLEKLAAEDVMKCHYLKISAAAVTTFPKKSLKEMIDQRARWAQKGSHTKSGLNKLMSFQVLAMSVAFLTGPFFLLLGWISFKLFVAIYLIKLFTDVVVLAIADRLFDKVNWPFVGLNFFIYPFLVIAVAIKSLGTPQWQGRNINTPKNPQG